MKNLKLLLGIIIGFILELGCIIFVDHAINQLIVNPALGGMAEFASRTLIFIIGYFIIEKMYKKSVAPSTKNLKKGLFVYGATFWILFISNLIFDHKTPTMPILSCIPSVIGILFSEMGTGVLEELVFRGFFFNAFVDRLGDTKRGVFASMILSSSVFGLCHLLNLISHPELLVATLAQILYAILMGSLFCVIYYRSRNLWPCIILHGIMDFTAKFWDCFTTAPKTDFTVLLAILSVALCLILFISAVVQLNNEFKTKRISQT